MPTGISVEELSRLTLEYGGEWGLQHANRLMALVERIGEGMAYDREIIRLAAYLHDWGGYAAWVVAGVEHPVRSCEVATGWLQEQGVTVSVIAPVIECIRYHHGGPAERSLESRLLTDADALDLLGVVGVCRIFSMCPRNLRTAYAQIQALRDASLAAISLPQTASLAEERVRETNDLLARFTDETMGMF